MGVIQQILLHQLLPIARVRAATGPQCREGRLIGQQHQRITRIEPGAQGAEEEAQPAWEGAGIILAHAKFNGIKRRLHHLRLNPVLG